MLQPPDPRKKISPEDFRNFLQVLEAISLDPAYLAGVSQEERILLMKAAGRLAHPTVEENRKIARAARRLRREKRKRLDREARQNTGIREAREAPVFRAHQPILPKAISAPASTIELQEPRYCYICKAAYTRVHSFYDTMCPACGDFNFQKRFQSA